MNQSMNRDSLLRDAQFLLLNAPKCVDGCQSCLALLLGNWAERIYKKGRRDMADDVLASVAGIYNREVKA